MGFFEALRDLAERQQTARDYNAYVREEEEAARKSSGYRGTAFANTPSNRGWYTCPRCGKKFRASGIDVDHIIPQSQGGDNSIDNLQLLCAHCNRSKQDDMSDAREDFIRRQMELNDQRKREREALRNLRDEDLDV